MRSRWTWPRGCNQPPSLIIYPPIGSYHGCIITGLHYVANKDIISTKCDESKPNLYFGEQLWVMRALDTGKSQFGLGRGLFRCSDPSTMPPSCHPSKESVCRMGPTLVLTCRALGLGGGGAKPPHWAGSPLEQLLLPPPPAPASGPRQATAAPQLDAGSRAGLFSITWVLTWPVSITRGHIPGSRSNRKARLRLQLRSHWF